MNRRRLRSRVSGAAGSLLLLAAACSATSRGEESTAESPRNTPLVKLVRRCLPSVVSIRTYTPHEKPGVFYVRAGSGSIIHEAGYILTNEHVINNAVRGDVTLYDGRTISYAVVAKFAHEDLALLRIRANKPLTPLPLGRSADLMLGEPTVVIGSPGGLAHSVSTGIVSGLNRATATEFTFLPWMVQTSAAVSGGNSGGPLINALGQQIGVITAKKPGLENINFAIAIDRLREVFPRMLAVEQRFGIHVGLQVDPNATNARITAVAKDSPAAQAKLRVGDVIRRVDAVSVRQGLDYHLALVDRKPGQQVKLQLLRGDKAATSTLTLAAATLAKPTPAKEMTPGLRFEAFEGLWNKLPDFAALKPIAQGHVAKIDVAAHKPGGDGFALRFRGFVKVPQDGLYTFYVNSDDGSRLRIGDQVVVDNDGLHPPRQSAGHVRLQAGLHPMTLTFFEHSGGESLRAQVEGPGLKRRDLGPDLLFRRKSTDK